MSESPAGLFRGLFETHLHVADLERAMRFYGEVLGLELGLKETERRAAFYWIGRDRNTMLGLWNGLRGLRTRVEMARAETRFSRSIWRLPWTLRT